tara:strand:- start:1494 stop:1928 length:435 start_codon:yes stop_codon:yes gene_type:complete
MNDKEPEERQFTIQRIYTKDISLESPNSPKIFLKDWTPNIEVGIESNAANLDDENIEVVLTVNVTAKVDDEVAFMVEVQQGAIFLVKGYDDKEIQPMLGIGAPSALFPYVREIISDLVARGSFPQFVLQPVNFEEMYTNKDNSN